MGEVRRDWENTKNSPSILYSENLGLGYPILVQIYLKNTIKENQRIPDSILLGIKGELILQNPNKWTEFKAEEFIQPLQQYTWVAYISNGKLIERFSAVEQYNKFKLFGVVPLTAKDAVKIKKTNAARLLIESLLFPGVLLKLKPSKIFQQENKVLLSVQFMDANMDLELDFHKHDPLLDSITISYQNENQKWIKNRITIQEYQKIQNYTIPKKFKFSEIDESNKELELMRATIVETHFK